MEFASEFSDTQKLARLLCRARRVFDWYEALVVFDSARHHEQAFVEQFSKKLYTSLAVGVDGVQ